MALERGPTEQVTNHYLQSGVNQSEAVINVKEMPRSSGAGTQLRITQFEWLTGLPLFYSEQVKARVDFEAYSDLSEVMIGIAFSTLEGVTIVTYETDNPGERVDVKKGSHCSVILELDSLPLPAGLYNVNIGANSGPSRCIDYLGAFTQVEVVPGTNTKGRHEGNVGVRLPSDWRWICSSC
jgi:hypothetical protein